MDNISKKEIKSIVSKHFKDEISKELKKALKDKKNKQLIRDIAVDVLVDYFKTIWIKRNIWKSQIEQSK